MNKGDVDIQSSEFGIVDCFVSSSVIQYVVIDDVGLENFMSYDRTKSRQTLL